MPSLLGEFKRRNVFRFGMTYLVIAWLIVQIVDIAQPALRLPEWVSAFVLLMLGVGLIPALLFAWAYEMTPEGIQKTKAVEPGHSITGQTGKKLDYVTIGALGIVVAMSFAQRYGTPDPAAPIEPVPAVAAATSDVISIAVLPFTNMSADADQEYFSDGISEEILNGLAKLKTLKVAGRTSSFAFKGRNEDLREIGSSLGVQHVLEGSVRKSGNTLRITAQLIKVSDGFHLWSETYDRELEDIFAVQDDISRAIIQELKVSLLGEEESTPKARQIDVLVYEEYLRARGIGRIRTNTNLVNAQQILEKVVEAEPGFAPGYSLLAEVIELQSNDLVGSVYGDLSRDEVNALVTPLLAKAIELDPESAHAYAVLGLNHMNEFRWEEADIALKRAVELNPSSASAWNWLSVSTSAIASPHQSLEYLARATAVDPLWLVPNANLIFRYSDLNRLDDSWEILNRLRPFYEDAAPVHALTGYLHLQVGEIAEAHKSFLRAQEIDGNVSGRILALHGTLSQLQEFDRAAEVLPEQYSFMQALSTRDWDTVLPGLRDNLNGNARQERRLGAYLSGAAYLSMYEEIAAFYDDEVKSPEFLADSGMPYYLTYFAMAMEAVERESDRQQILAVLKANYDKQAAEGINSPEYLADLARFYVVSDEHEKGFETLKMVLSRGAVIPDWSLEPELMGLFEDPRFAELKAANLAAINREREKLGWSPVLQVRE